MNTKEENELKERIKKNWAHEKYFDDYGNNHKWNKNRVHHASLLLLLLFEFMSFSTFLHFFLSFSIEILC